jgi:hypothetical protein
LKAGMDWAAFCWPERMSRLEAFWVMDPLWKTQAVSTTCLYDLQGCDRFGADR